MDRLIAISKIELQKHPDVECAVIGSAEKINEVSNMNVYSSPLHKITDLICLLRESHIQFKIYSDLNDLKNRNAKGPVRS